MRNNNSKGERWKGHNVNLFSKYEVQNENQMINENKILKLSSKKLGLITGNRTKSLKPFKNIKKQLKTIKKSFKSLKIIRIH